MLIAVYILHLSHSGEKALMKACLQLGEIVCDLVKVEPYCFGALHTDMDFVFLHKTSSQFHSIQDL